MQSDTQSTPDPKPAESRVVDSVIHRLEPYFHVQREVGGTHFTGKRLRIDAILRPRNPLEWKRRDVALGLEFKHLAYLNDTKDETKWLAQCADYANTEWDGCGHCYVFGYGMFRDLYGDIKCPRDERERIGWYVARLMGRFGVGELTDVRWHGLTLVLQGEHRVWSERTGVSGGRRWTLDRRWGSR